MAARHCGSNQDHLTKSFNQEMSMDVVATTIVKTATVSAVIIRADGTRVDLGVISRYHKNPLKRMWFKFTEYFRVQAILRGTR